MNIKGVGRVCIILGEVESIVLINHLANIYPEENKRPKTTLKMYLIWAWNKEFPKLSTIY